MRFIIFTSNKYLIILKVYGYGIISIIIYSNTFLNTV